MTDTSVRTVPPLPKPAVGQTVVDPVWSSRITRLTDAANIPGSGRTCRPEYSTVSAWSLDNANLLLLTLDHFCLFSGAGQFVRDMPGIFASAQPRWSRRKNERFYFLNGNTLMVYDFWLEGKWIIRAFPEYVRIDGKGESDVAQDRDAFVFAGVKSDSSVEAFVYDVETDTKYPAVQVPSDGFDSLYLSADAQHFTVTLGDGIYLYSRNGGGSLGRIATSGSHMDLCRVDGVNLLVRTNSNDNPPLSGCDNGIEAVPLLDPGARRCLLPLPYNGWNQAVHVSAADTGIVLVESYQAIDSAWGPYSGEIIKLDLRTGAVTRLCHHRSAVANYECMPLTSVRRDGKAAVFGSNWGDPSGVVDTYLLEVEAAPAPTPAPQPPPVVTPPIVTPPPAPTPIKHHPHGGGHKKIA